MHTQYHKAVGFDHPELAGSKSSCVSATSTHDIHEIRMQTSPELSKIICNEVSTSRCSTARSHLAGCLHGPALRLRVCSGFRLGFGCKHRAGSGCAHLWVVSTIARPALWRRIISQVNLLSRRTHRKRVHSLGHKEQAQPASRPGGHGQDCVSHIEIN